MHKTGLRKDKDFLKIIYTHVITPKIYLVMLLFELISALAIVIFLELFFSFLQIGSGAMMRSLLGLRLLDIFCLSSMSSSVTLWIPFPVFLSSFGFVQDELVSGEKC